MPGNVAGLLLTLGLICLSYLVSLIFKSDKLIQRKVLHIGVSLFAFIYLGCFDDDLIPILGLSGFAILNLFTGKNSKGMFLYPLSVVFMIGVKNLGFGNELAVSRGLLVMGLGDGFAAIIGSKLGKKRIPGTSDKTVAGFISCFLFSAIAFFLPGFIFSNAESGMILISFVVGLIASLVELYSPSVIDNMTVPFTTFVLSVLFD